MSAKPSFGENWDDMLEPKISTHQNGKEDISPKNFFSFFKYNMYKGTKDITV